MTRAGKRAAVLAVAFGLAGATAAADGASRQEKRHLSAQGLIAFHGGHGARGLGVYVMRSDATGVRQLTRGAQDDLVSWSGDGRRIAFVRSSIRGGQPRSDVFVVNLDGSGLHRLLPDAEFVAWSPDGREIAFTRVEAGLETIYVSDASGSSARRIATVADFGGLAWAPDGRRIAYAASELDAQGNAGEMFLAVMDADGTNVHRLIANGFSPAWSPEGRRIAFVRGFSDVGETWVIAAKGGTPRRVTRNAEHPSWSPDGTKLVVGGGFHRTGALGTEIAYDALFVVAADGTNRKVLYPPGPRPPIEPSNPAWHR